MYKVIKTFKLLLVAILYLIIFLIYSVIIVACDSKDGINVNSSSTSHQRLTIYDNKLMVGSDTTYPPFEYLKDGEIIGFDIDLATEIAHRLEIDIEIVPIIWDFTYELPEDIKVDMIISAVSADEGRGKLADFSDTYYVLEYMLITLSEAKLKIKEDLKGKKIGILAGAVSNLSSKYLKNFIIEKYDSKLLILEAIRSKKIDGALISIPVGKNIIEENKRIYSVLEIVKSERELNIVFPEGSPLKDEVNRILAEIKEDGTYKEIYDKWFSFHK